MKKENKHSIHQNNKSDFKGKLGIALLGIGILAVAIAGYSYYSGSKGSDGSIINTSQGGGCPMANQGGGCPMMNNTNSASQGGGCGMMGNNTPNQSNQSAQNQPSVQDQTSPIIPTDSNAELITMNYNESGLEPSVVNVQVGKSYTISINANTDVYGCMSTIDIPGLDENMQSIRKGKTITFNIKPTTAGEYDFKCAMGRSHNAKVVVK